MYKLSLIDELSIFELLDDWVGMSACIVDLFVEEVDQIHRLQGHELK